MRNLSNAMLSGKQKSIRSTLRECPYWAGVFVAMFIALFMTSCNDEDLAKEAHGVWTTGKHWDEDEVGNPMLLQETYFLKYNPKASFDGGEFMEVDEAYLVYEFDDLIIDITLSSSIHGKWEVSVGDICFTYDLSSLDVDIEDLDVRLSDDADYFTRLLYQEMQSEGFMNNIDIRDISEKLRDMFYEDLYNGYQQDSSDGLCGFGNVMIEGETLSYDSDDGEREILTRVNNEDE